MDRRLTKPALAIVILYLLYAALSAATDAAGWRSGDGLQRMAAAGLPLLPVLASALVFAGAWRRLDEVERAMHRAGFVVGFTAMLLAALIDARLEAVGMTDAIGRFVWAVGVLGWGAGLLAGRRAYR